MQAFEYTTGRDYGKPQVLTITVESMTDHDMGTIDLIATFIDGARGISGRVNTVMFPHETVGAAVLAAYDHGNYSLLA